MRILYVEDNPANLFLVQRVARMGNHEVVNYSEGQPALDHFKEDKPDLVLMDIQLAGKLNGLDVVKALRAAGHRTPIIAVTAYAMSGDRERCLEAGCDGYLSKPLPVGELVELFKRYEPAVNPATVPTRPIAVPDAKPEVATTEAQPVPENPQPAATGVENKPAPEITLVNPAAQPAAAVEPPKGEAVPAPAVTAPETKTETPLSPAAPPVAAATDSPSGKESAPPVSVETAKESTEKPAAPLLDAKPENPASPPASEPVKPAESGVVGVPAAQGVSKEADEKISLESKSST